MNVQHSLRTFQARIGRALSAPAPQAQERIGNALRQLGGELRPELPTDAVAAIFHPVFQGPVPLQGQTAGLATHRAPHPTAAPLAITRTLKEISVSPNE